MGGGGVSHGPWGGFGGGGGGWLVVGGGGGVYGRRWATALTLLRNASIDGAATMLLLRNNGVGEKGVAVYIFGSENRDVCQVMV